jgi:hypothetical protein
MKKLEEMCEAGYLQRGVEYYDDKRVGRPSRFENKLFGEVKGSGGSYKVTVEFTDKVKARCSCPAARRTPLCKHSVALLVTWAKAPESFVTAKEAPAVEAAGGRKKASVKKGEAKAEDLMGAGLEAMGRLLQDVGSTGLAAMTPGRVRETRDLAQNLRTFRLRRLSTALTRFADTLEASVQGSDEFDVSDYARQMVDLIFTARAVGAIRQGKLKDDRYLEELVGQTWSKKNLAPVSGLKLCELAYERIETVDGYRIESSSFVDLAGGDLLSEKYIAPAFLKAETKPSYAGQTVEASSAYLYPGFAPRRVKFEEFRARTATQADLEGALGRAVPDFETLRQAWVQFRQDVFAPDDYPAWAKIAGLLARERRLSAMDSDGRLLPLVFATGARGILDGRLTKGSPQALFGVLDQRDGILRMRPLSMMLRVGSSLEIQGLTE